MFKQFFATWPSSTGKKDYSLGYFIGVRPDILLIADVRRYSGGLNGSSQLSVMRTTFPSLTSPMETLRYTRGLREGFSADHMMP
jgi:hypothetical protein